MGAMVTVIYNRDAVDGNEVSTLSEVLKNIVETAINDKDVFVYVSSPEKVFGADPIEVFVQVNAQKTTDTQAVLSNIATKFKTWKAENNFAQSINVNVIPVDWYSQINL